jgi:hypothetical protein
MSALPTRRPKAGPAVPPGRSAAEVAAWAVPAATRMAAEVDSFSAGRPEASAARSLAEGAEGSRARAPGPMAALARQVWEAEAAGSTTMLELAAQGVVSARTTEIRGATAVRADLVVAAVSRATAVSVAAAQDPPASTSRAVLAASGVAAAAALVGRAEAADSQPERAAAVAVAVAAQGSGVRYSLWPAER